MNNNFFTNSDLHNKKTKNDNKNKTVLSNQDEDETISPSNVSGNNVSNAERLAYEKRIEELLKKYEELKNAPQTSLVADKKDRDDALKKLEDEIEKAKNQLKNVANNDAPKSSKEIGRNIASATSKTDVNELSSANSSPFSSQLGGGAETNSALKSALIGKTSGSGNAINQNGNLYIKVLSKEDINYDKINEFIKEGVSADQIESIKVRGEVLMFKLPGEPYININDIDEKLRKEILAKLGLEDAGVINDEVKKVEEIQVVDNAKDAESELARIAKLQAQLRLYKVEM